MPPRGGAARGAVTRGVPARGGAVRSGPASRGGLSSTPARGAVAPRARPPASGPPQRMGPPPPHNPATAAESYEEYVSDDTLTGYRTTETFVLTSLEMSSVKPIRNMKSSLIFLASDVTRLNLASRKHGSLSAFVNLSVAPLSTQNWQILLL